MLRGFVLGGTEGHHVPLSCMDLYKPSINGTSIMHEAQLVSADLNKRILLWNPSEIIRPVGSLNGSYYVCHKLQFSKNEHFKIYAACDKDILVWDVRNSQQPLHSWKVGIDKITSFDLSESDNCLAVSNDSNNIYFLSTVDGSLLHSKSTLHTDVITDVKFRPNKKWNQMITGSLDGSILFTDWSPRGIAKAILELSDYQDMDDVVDSDNDADGSSSSSDSSSSNSLMNVLNNPPQVRCLSCSDSGKYFVSGLRNGCLMTFNIADKNPCQSETISCHTGIINCVTFVQDCFTLSGGQDCMLTCLKLDPNGYQQRILNDRPVRQIQARSLSRVFVIDSSKHIYMFDMSHM